MIKGVTTKSKHIVWRKATASNPSGSCVELAYIDQDTRGVRDSKNPQGPVLLVEKYHLRNFLSTVTSEF
jgi:hypothetical protein